MGMYPKPVSSCSPHTPRSTSKDRFALPMSTDHQPVGQPTSTSYQSTVRPTSTTNTPAAHATLINGPPALQAQPLLASSQCRPLGANFRFCSGDIAAIAGAVFFICYVVWGIPLTVRFYKYLRSKLAARRQRQLAMSQDLERNPERDCPSGGAASSSSTLQGFHERDLGHAFPPLDDKIKSALDQRRLNNFRYPVSDSWTSIPHSILTIPRSPTQEFYSAPATPVPGYDESTSTHNSSPTTLPGDGEEKCEDGAAVDSQDSTAPSAVSEDQPFGRIRAICKPCMW